MVLRVHLVFHRARALATGDAGADERKPLARNSTGMGKNFQQLRPVLACAELAGGYRQLAARSVVEEIVARVTNADEK